MVLDVHKNLRKDKKNKSNYLILFQFIWLLDPTHDSFYRRWCCSPNKIHLFNYIYFTF